ncbi:hypothetical protein [Roseibium sp.]|uniref:hypothetical protein n=1 Tax=Roseibium sp. TaxID=1936156 RepID=UPI003B5274A3
MAGWNKPRSKRRPNLAGLLFAALEAACRGIAFLGVWFGKWWAKSWHALADFFRSAAEARGA